MEKQASGFTPKRGNVARLIRKRIRGSVELPVTHDDGTVHRYLIELATGAIHGKIPNQKELDAIRKFRKATKEKRWPKGPKGYSRGTIYVTDPKAYQEEKVREAYEMHMLQSNPKKYYGERQVRNHEAWWQKEN